MSNISDKLLGFFHLDDDYEDDDYEEYDDYAEEDVKPARGYKRSRPQEDEEEFSGFEKRQKEAAKPARAKTTSKVVPMRTGRGGMEVCVIKPTSVEESREVTDTLLSGRAVILNLEGLHVEIAQRIVDFTSGSCYAVNGNLQKVSNYIFIITPESVEISGDFLDTLSGGFDVSAFNK